METIESHYTSKCEELGVEPGIRILDALRRADVAVHESPEAGTQFVAEERGLDLSGISLSFKGWKAFTHALRFDSYFTSLILADSNIDDDAAIMICAALKDNTCLKLLDMRGNSIKLDGSVAVAQMLKLNTTLRVLRLEWNCLGIWDQGVRNIADALGFNHALAELDLRNNKIGPHSAEVLASSLKHNTSLRKLDFRWNNVGAVGGRAFLECLRWNKALTEIDLTGNQVPEDLVKSILHSLQRNQELTYAKTLITAQRDNMHATIGDLTKNHAGSLAELSKKFLVNQADLAATQLKIDEMQHTIARLTEERRELEASLLGETKLHDVAVKQYESEITRLRAGVEAAKADTDKIQHRRLELEAAEKDLALQIEVLKREKRVMGDELDALRARDTRLRAEVDEKLQRQRAEFEQRAAQLDKDRAAEVQQKVKQYEEKLLTAELQRRKVEEELEVQKRKVESVRQQHEEVNAQLEQRVRRDEEAKRRGLDTELSSLRQAHQQLQAQHDKHMQAHNALLDAHEAQVARLMEKNAAFLAQLSDAKAQHAGAAAEVTQLRAVVADQQKTADRHAATEREFRTRTQGVEAQLADAVSREARARQDAAAYQERLRSVEVSCTEKEREAAALRAELKRRDDHIRALRDEDVARMRELEVAISGVLRKTRSYGGPSGVEN